MNTSTVGKAKSKKPPSLPGVYYQIGGGGGGEVHVGEETEGCRPQRRVRGKPVGKSRKEGDPKAGLYHLGGRLTRAGVVLPQRLSITSKVRAMAPFREIRQWPF